MAIEPTVEKVWEEFYNSKNSALMKLADELCPELSIREEKDNAVRGRDVDRVIYIGKVLRKYTGPKDTFVKRGDALNALSEIREYKA